MDIADSRSYVTMINSLNRSNIIINNNTEKECAVMQGNLSFMINATYQLEGWHGGRQGDLNEQGDGWHGGRQGDLNEQGDGWHGGRQGDLNEQGDGWHGEMPP